MIIENRLFWPNNVYEEGDYKSALDRLNKYILNNNIKKRHIINVETKTDDDGNTYLNLFYWRKK